MGRLVLAIDFGSTWCKAAYVDRAGRIVAEGRAYTRWGAPFGPGVEDLTRVWNAIVLSVQAAGELLRERGHSPAPDALALACRGMIGVWLDGDDRPIDIPPGTIPSVAHETVAEVYGSSAWAPEDPYAYSYVPSLVGRTLWLKRNHPALWQRIRRAGALHDWILWRLTGEWITDPATGPGQATWPDAAMTLTGLPSQAFPRVAAFTKIVGTLTPTAAADLGLPSATPVVAGYHDGAAANIGAGAFRPGDACITLGTNFVLRVVSDRVMPHWFGYLIDMGRWAWVRGAGGLATQIDAVASVLDEREGQVTAARHAALTALAESVPPGARGLRLLALPAGEERRQVAAACAALAAGHDRGTIYRATLEGMALAIRGLLDVAQNAGMTTRRFVVTGGGTANALLMRILSGVLGVVVEVVPGEAGLHGAAIAAAVGAGWYPGIVPAAARMVPASRRSEASAEELSTYAELLRSIELPRSVAPGGRPR